MSGRTPPGGAWATDEVVWQLWSERAIQNLVVGFSLGMDALDYGLFRRAWADEVELDLGTLAGAEIQLAGTRPADDYARDALGLLSGFTATQHLSTNHLVAVQGEDATCVCYTHAQHFLADGERWLTAGSRYDLTARWSGEGGWRFTRFSLTNLWTRGDRSIWQAATRARDRRAIT